MISSSHRTRFAQRGVVLVAALLLLIVVTIMALSMFRSFGIQEKIAGNMREKQRALNAAEAAEVYAEIWLTNNGNSVTPSVNCVGPLNANIGQGQICANVLPLIPVDVTKPPYMIAGVPVGVTYLPDAMPVGLIGATSVFNADPTQAKFAFAPGFYISDLGLSGDPNVPGEVYQIDAYGYGASPNTVAVVESTFAVYTSSSNRTL